MSTIAIITARGGSKRIPRKNIKNFLGKPIMLYSIEAAFEAEIFDEVMVSTDDEEIAEIARKAGACVPFMRSAAASDDYATTTDVLLEVLEGYKKIGKMFDYMACLYPANPFITAEKLKKCMQLICSSDYAQVLPVVPFSYPPQRAYVFSDDGYLRYKWDEFKNARSQDLEKMYHDAGQFYFYQVASFIKHKGVYGKIYPLICSEYEVQDIDTEEDWKMAELKAEYIKAHVKDIAE